MTAARADQPSLHSRRRWVLRAGFAALLVLIGLSVFMAYRIQRQLSDGFARSQRAYIQQEESLYNLRRALWQSSILVRDFLLDVSPNREAVFQESLALRRREAAEAVRGLERSPIPGQDVGLTARLGEFWATVEAVPGATRTLDSAGRYAYVQNEVAPRRLKLSELVRDITSLGRGSLETAERTMTASRQSAARQLLGVISLALVAGSIFAAICLRRLDRLETEAASQYDEALRTKAELQALSADLLSIQESERARLSRELHDEIGQALATLRLELARVESSVRGEVPGFHSRLVRARAIVDSSLKTVRNISLMLRPSLLDDLGLMAALQALAEDLTRSSGIRCTVRGEAEAVNSLPAEHRTCIYRVVQEAVHNVTKHAGASEIAIEIGTVAGQLEISVEDDGVGVSADDLKRWRGGGHLGVLGMRERVAALGGEFRIGRGERGGTRVWAALPASALEPA